MGGRSGRKAVGRKQTSEILKISEVLISEVISPVPLLQPWQIPQAIWIDQVF